MKLNWINDDAVKGKQCWELHEEFGINLSAFECSKGDLVGHCSVDKKPIHWTGVVGIKMGPGKCIGGHASTMKEAMRDAEKSVVELLKWRKDYWKRYSNSIYGHICRIEDQMEMMKDD